MTEGTVRPMRADAVRNRQRLLEVVEKTPVTLVMREGARITSERGGAA